MLFKQLKLENVPGLKEPSIKWYMIIRTVEEVLQYMNIDSELMMNAMLALPENKAKSHLEGSRERVLDMAFYTEVFTCEQTNTKPNPMNVLNKLIRSKAEGMFTILKNKNFVLVQENGGYCPYEGYVETWNAEILDEVEKTDCYFPTDIQPMETDLLFLENSERVPVGFENDIKFDHLKQLTGKSYDSNLWNSVNTNFTNGVYLRKEKAPICYKLNQLKLRDPKFVATMITKAKIIAVQTHLADSLQLEKFMQLFSTLEKKIIYIRTSYVNELKSHPLFEINNSKHQLIFV